LVGTTLGDANEPLERIRECIAGFDWSVIDPKLRVTITIGATEFVPGESVEELICRADLALYLGKEAGRDRVVLDAAPVERLKLRSPVAAE
jgi:diguanylate cyclase